MQPNSQESYLLSSEIANLKKRKKEESEKKLKERTILSFYFEAEIQF
jgi:hypothetical protein